MQIPLSELSFKFAKLVLPKSHESKIHQPVYRLWFQEDFW
jgi:hypothetical protein